MKIKNRALIFIIDDDPEMQTLLRKLFTLDNYNVETFSNALTALKRLDSKEESEKEKCGLIICDLKLPDISGLEFIEKVKLFNRDIPVILMTAYASVETAVEALKKGAFDYIVKPIHLSEISDLVNQSFHTNSLEKNTRYFQSQTERQHKSSSIFERMTGTSKNITLVFDLINRVAKTNSNVLITGESGTGKDLVAKSIHYKSERNKLPFIAVNCSSIPDQLLESELFGHRKGSFTGATENRRGLFEEAQGGTIFLDEIGDMPFGLQSKLLRVLQDRQIKPVGDNQSKELDIRIISATHKNLKTLIHEGKFREDLFYRICVIPIHIPPLRERKEDIPLIVSNFLIKYSNVNRTNTKKLTKRAINKLMNCAWPGNIRELENTLERAIVLTDREWIDDKDVIIEEEPNQDAKIKNLFAKLLTLEEIERFYIEYVLQTTNYSKEKTFAVLGIDRKTLYRKLIKYQNTIRLGNQVDLNNLLFLE